MSISIATRMMITMLISTMIIVESNGTYKRDKVPRLLDDSRHFLQLNRDSRGYIEQCRPTNLRKEQSGHVNVFAFLDPFWYYSYRQAIMLGVLKKRLEKSGFSNILYFVVTPPPDLPEDDTENNVEIKAWRKISKNIHRSQYFSEERLLSDLAKNKKDIIFLQDTSELGIWKTFHASKDEVVIIDRCGKVTYQIIVPWSILYFPYVKAAILSTYKEDPCGPCYEESLMGGDSIDYKEYLLKTINSGETKTEENLDTHTEKVFTDAKIASVEKSKEIEEDKNTSTTVAFDANTYESTISDITTEASTVQIETTENMKNDKSIQDNIFFTNKNIEITSEIPFEEKQTQISTVISNFETTEVYEDAEDCNFSNKQLNRNNNSFSMINDSNADLTRNFEDRLVEPDVSSEDTKKEQDANENTGHKLQNQKDESVPLRLIMYAPHLHNDNGTLKKYTHLVLKTGSPDYHDHFYSKSTTSNQEPATLNKSDSTILNDKSLAQYIDSVNESPGVYGEIVDYWRSTSEDELINNNENTEFADYDYAMAEDLGSNINDAFDSESGILNPSDNDTIDSDTNMKNNDDMDGFIQRRLIEHYNKLLTWICYIL